MLDTEYARSRMVERQVARRGVTDPHVLDAMRAVPRERFVPEGMQEFAYEDSPLPIEAGQTISQPYIVAHMIEAAGIAPGDRVLEIGAGSGYAAAVMSRIADRVFTIERHAELSDLAARRLREIGYDNVEVRTGDGTLGWPEEAPFDAILAAAGGHEIPNVLLDQLAIGGRLVMPVGADPRRQSLMQVIRTGAAAFERADLGEVVFVPLIGEHGWSEDESGPQRRAAEPRSFRAPDRSVPEMIRDAAIPLRPIDDPLFAIAFDRFADARVVLLGEASHGTSEFYRARAAITRRLIEEHGFSIVAIEADWPDAALVDRFVRHQPIPRDAEPAFTRFPTWMWRNVEMQGFLQWMRDHNRPLPHGRRAGLHGLDLYNLQGSIRAVIDYLDRIDPDAAAVARERYGCLTPWSNEPQTYGRMALSSGYAACEAPVAEMLSDLLKKHVEYAEKDGDSFLDAAQSARLIQSAEAYYRAMYYGSAESWNLRDTHMFETLDHVLAARGVGAKAVVWAHNSHIGDARFTEMGVSRDELNLGQLCKQRWGDEACLIGFGTHAGTVAAATDWDAPMEVKRVLPSREDSYERLAHDSGRPCFLLDLREAAQGDVELRHALLAPRLERFIGVIYRPDTERWSHYADCSLPRQFDGYVWFDETKAVTPLPGRTHQGPDETWPFGL